MPWPMGSPEGSTGMCSMGQAVHGAGHNKAPEGASGMGWPPMAGGIGSAWRQGRQGTGGGFQHAAPACIVWGRLCMGQGMARHRRELLAWGRASAVGRVVHYHGYRALLCVSMLNKTVFLSTSFFARPRVRVIQCSLANSRENA